MKKLLWVICLSLILISCNDSKKKKSSSKVQNDTEQRTWELKSGTRVKGKLLTYQDNYVIIKKTDGKKAKIKLENLIQDDKTYVATFYDEIELPSDDNEEDEFQITYTNQQELKPKQTNIKAKPIQKQPNETSVHSNYLTGVWEVRLDGGTKMIYRQFSQKGYTRIISLGDKLIVGGYISFSLKNNILRYGSKSYKLKKMDSGFKLTGGGKDYIYKKSNKQFSDNLIGKWHYQRPYDGKHDSNSNYYQSIEISDSTAQVLIRHKYNNQHHQNHHSTRRIPPPPHRKKRKGKHQHPQPTQHERKPSNELFGSISRIPMQPSKMTISSKTGTKLKIDNIIVVDGKLYAGNTILTKHH